MGDVIRHTRAERRVIEASAELARAWNSLRREEGDSHPSHSKDVERAIHDVQRVVAMRLARRADPEAWGGTPRPELPSGG